MEHGHGGISEALPLVFKPWLPLKPQLYSRLPESSAAWAKKALDLGPQGIMFRKPSPIAGTHQTEYVERPHPVVRASKYGIDEEHINKCEKELLIMCQVGFFFFFLINNF